MRRPVVLLVCAGLALAVWGLTPERGAAEAAAAVAPAASPSPDFVPWVPSESWAGGRQYDPRLEKTVKFWGAGMPLREVFAGVREQTGVEIGFWPAGDVNERICVTLYLNPEQPPTLRELMAQVSWVMDCGFGYATDGGGDKEAGYYLMSTSIGDGMLDTLRKAEETREAQRQKRSAERKAALLKAVAAKLTEYRKALEMSREEAIARYHGVDDMLLLNMLDPARRAITRFVCQLPEDDLGPLLLGEKDLYRHWRDWTPEQQSDLKEGLGIGESQLEGPGVEVVVVAATPGWIELMAAELPPEGEAGIHYRFGGEDRRTLVAEDALLGRHDLQWDEVIALRRLLGERITPGEEEAFRLQCDAAREAEVMRRRREQLGDRMSANRSLSPEAAALLCSVSLPLEKRTQCTLWEVQEAVALATESNVASDCFWQPRRGFEFELELSLSDGLPDVTALLALSIWCGHELVSDPGGGPGWEWGDAGSFLRFRSVHRDVARGSLLPEEVLDEMDGWLEPPLQQALAAEPRRRNLEVHLDLGELSRAARQLDDLQVRFGGSLICGDPAEASNAARLAFRTAVLEVVDVWPQLFRFLGSFSDGQWRRVRGKGLQWGKDLTPNQQASPTAELARRQTEGPIEETVLRVRESAGVPDAEGGPEPSMYWVELLANGRQCGLWHFPSALTVGLGSTERLAGLRNPTQTQ